MAMYGLIGHYTHLPVHLKPCFLYMGIFPEDHIIRDSHMIKLWVAEGFIKPNKSQSLEEIARGYLNDLIDMNLILKHSLGSNGKIQYCKIHDLLRDLCLKVSQKDKFVCMMNDIPQGVDMEPPTITNNRTLVTLTVWGIPTRSIRMLRVIVVFGKLWTTKKILIQDAFAQVNLRYLDYERFLFGKIPSSITMLWNVQNLYIKGLRGGADAPSEIWEMRQLRHVHIMGLVLPDPSPSDQKDDSVLLNNLQTLKKVNNLRYSVEVCKRVLNVKTLSIQYNKFAKRFKDNCLYNCCRLQKLESLKFQYPREHDALQDLTFLSSLKKLYLRCCTIKWEDLTTIGSLPHLEVLKLRLSPNTAGHVWNPIEGEFLRLKFLFIECIYLVNWNADSSHFPVLEKLVLEEMEKLEEIPLDIGEIPALGAISLKSCSESSAISAVKIAEERENGGNEALQLQVEFFYKAQMESFLEKMERESLTINNLELKLTSNW
ncbi:PREDICTED: putative late blight resistance protein homolog R1B-16 [Erythranthe guttata]|uniref:putative late blight resistance protein homolog R1B-16 n=1 Tax=Erythranthe guttata TaxID=4155 RepID=UPI00064DB073|nr:PREDICTED: putative late blight resistance protein homolog R1B-16 [Erythranthe guttata]|eukprot:XP_012853770.1 PREDICTED: putative late blight resistance protein homolog R1B-16 [Erythranthe guttata]